VHSLREAIEIVLRAATGGGKNIGEDRVDVPYAGTAAKCKNKFDPAGLSVLS